MGEIGPVPNSKTVRWISALSKTKSGQTCYINYPSEEVFTTPDTRVTEGTIVASMPLPVNGALVTDLVLEFKGGKLVDFFAREGREVLAEWLNVDGGRFLGEFALVGTDSPVSQSGLFFHHPHIDENGASHIALGMGILSCLSGGEEMSENALRDLGLNISSIHTDIMFGSSEVGIVATKTRRGAVVLMDRGVWV